MLYYTAPTATDDSSRGIQIGDLWPMPAEGKVYIARDVTAGAAIWTLKEPNQVSLLGGPVSIDNGAPTDKFTFTAVAQTFVLDVGEYNSVTLQIGLAGAHAGAFEVSIDGVNWVSALGFNVATGAVATSLTNPVLGILYRFTTTAVRYFRVRTTAWTANATYAFYRSKFPAEQSDAMAPLPAGSNSIGSVIAQLNAVSGAGALTSSSRLLSAAGTTNPMLLKGSAGRIYKIKGYNAATAVRYLKIYNKATAPVPGTDTPVDTVALKPSDTFELDFGAIGRFLTTGIGLGITLLPADNDATVLTAGDIVGMTAWYA